MSDLNALKTKIEGLSKTLSSDTTFRNTYQLIEEACLEPENTNSSTLSNILSIFRDEKLNGRDTLNRIRADVKDLDEKIKLGNVAARISSIEKRNIAIKNLSSKLDEQSKKAVKDANLLKTIKDIIDKTTATVEVINNLIKDLEESDDDAKKILKAFVKALDEGSSIFKPAN
jgi:methyl-accepting chemotaxis protein